MAQLRKIEYGNNNDGNSVPLQNTLQRTAPEVVKCAACGKIVREKESRVRLEDRVFHLPCFACFVCKRSLKEGKAFQNSAGKFQCELCYKSTCVKCARCTQPITDSVFVSKSEKEKFHRDCFCCATCERPINGVFYEHAGQPYCREDYLVVTALNCAKCRQPIRPLSSDPSAVADSCSVPQIVFRSKPYHPNCFVCDACDGTLDVQLSVAPLTESDKLLNPPTRSQAAATKVTKQYYPMDGQKLCKACAKARAKQKKAEAQKSQNTKKQP